jgi:hypothetical protein
MILAVNISLNSINRLVVAIKTQFVLSEVHTDILSVTVMSFKLQDNIRDLNLAAVKLTTFQIAKLPL